MVKLGSRTIKLDTGKCLHSIDRFATCSDCFDLCPAKAIKPGRPPTLIESNCTNCLSCLPACPVGAYQGDDSVPSILKCVSFLKHKSVDLLCERHSRPNTGADEKGMGLQVRGCLASLGVGALVGIGLAGLKGFALRLDTCQNCERYALKKVIQQQVETAKEILAVLNIEPNITCIESLNLETERPFWQADTPPVTRRDMFKLIVDKGRMKHVEAPFDGHEKRQTRIGRNNYRISSIAGHIQATSERDKTFPSGIPLASVAVNDNCNGCKACARICPTGALQFDENAEKKKFSILHTVSLCIGCEACVHVCPTAAIDVDHHPKVNQVFNKNDRLTLITGKLKSCEKCGVLFVDKQAEQLCPVCSSTKRNLFRSLR